jgi:hypothetical protein
MKKYTLVTISGIHTQIALQTDVQGYTEGVFEDFIPTDEEMKDWSESDAKKWTVENNKRMKAICNFLNEKSL